MMDWWRFWSETFIIVRDDLAEYWMDYVAHLATPCHPSWHRMYVSRLPVANDNRRIDA